MGHPCLDEAYPNNGGTDWVVMHAIPSKVPFVATDYSYCNPWVHSGSPFGTLGDC